MSDIRYRFISAFIAVAGCGPNDGSLTSCLALEEAGRFGYGERASVSADSSLDVAGVLGDVRGVFRDAAGQVFVLDRANHRIVVFGGDGHVDHVIEGGEGDGPGEFRLPMHLVPTPQGLSVIDYELVRLTEFGRVGGVRRVTGLNTPPPWRHVVRNDTAFVAYGAAGSSSGALFHMVALETGSMSAGPNLFAEDRPFGGSVGITLGRGGEILVNTARPGVWMAYRGRRWNRVGTPSFPEDGPPVTEQTGPSQSRVTPSQHVAAGLATIGDSMVVQGVTSLAREFDWNNPPRRDEYIPSIGIFRADGAHIKTFDMPPGTSPAFLQGDSNGKTFFVVVTEPFPQVVEYKLVPCVALK